MKRIFDSIVILMASPVLLFFGVIVALFVAFFLGRPVLFAQVRPGLNGEPFKMYKFRSMANAVDQQGKMLPDSDRLGSFGKILRSTSLDELPELWNVLKGDMSLVGPRPLLMEYMPLYSEFQLRRHDVLPGITGWAQINGRNAISWDKKFELDVWYVENRSFFLDLKILLITLKKLFIREGISADGEVTMPPFLGSNNFDRD